MGMLLSILVFSYVYEDADSLIVQNDSLVICGYHQYNIKVEIADSAKLKVRQWNGMDSTGWLCLEAPLVLIHGSSTLVGAGLGFLGGMISHPDGYGTGYGGAGDPSGGSGGGAGYGGAGGDGADIGPGAGGIAYGSPIDTIISFGSGGGAGQLGTVDAFGGNGGASFYAKATKVVIDSATIECNGESGDEGSLEAGGGGSGGGIMFRADSVFLHGVVMSANGGAGGNAEFGGGGGAGGGRIKVFYASVFDTVNLVTSSSGGNGGVGGYGNGENGLPGSIYIAPLVGFEEFLDDAVDVFTAEPNPTRGILKIRCEGSPQFIKFYDVCGREVSEFKMSKSVEYMDINGLNAGVYFMKGGGSEAVIKIIKLK